MYPDSAALLEEQVQEEAAEHTEEARQLVFIRDEHQGEVEANNFIEEVEPEMEGAPAVAEGAFDSPAKEERSPAIPVAQETAPTLAAEPTSQPVRRTLSELEREDVELNEQLLAGDWDIE